MFYNVRQIAIPAQEEERYNARILKKHKGGYYLKRYDTNKLYQMVQNIDKLNPERCSRIVRGADGTKEAVRIINSMDEGMGK